jgi:PAS domain S-box-containing protein
MKILFLSRENRCRSVMAQAFVQARGEGDVVAVSAGIEPALEVHPLAVRVLAEIGLDVSGLQPRALDLAEASQCDLLVGFCEQLRKTCPMLPGGAPCLDWNVSDPATLAGGREEDLLVAFRRTRDLVRQLVDDFFERGYCSLLSRIRHQEELILSNISDGIIAHDMDRRIFYMNRSAETITGFARSEVLGRDCHEVFPDGFCEGRCLLEQPDGIPDEPFERPLTRKDGERVILRQASRLIRDEKKGNVGILTTFHDVTRESHLARRVGDVSAFSGIVGSDSKMLEIYDLIRDLADTNMPVLIQGESGTGKELVAAAIHNEGPRASKLFVPVNCGALPESLLESELFGHVKGAFTGAVRDKKGRFELADGGTIFLDEIGDITPAMQVKLLRVLQEGTFERVGGEKTIKVDVRVISATNKDIQQEILEGRFREDLYYRLGVVPLFLPPLRDRRADIPLLVDHVLARIADEAGRGELTLSPETLDLLMVYDWPGNIRELQNWLRFAAVRSRGKMLEPEHLPPTHHRVYTAIDKGSRRRLTAAAVREALMQTGGNKVEAAKVLGVSRATLYRFLDRERL